MFRIEAVDARFEKHIYPDGKVVTYPREDYLLSVVLKKLTVLHETVLAPIIDIEKQLIQLLDYFVKDAAPKIQLLYSEYLAVREQMQRLEPYENKYDSTEKQGAESFTIYSDSEIAEFSDLLFNVKRTHALVSSKCESFLDTFIPNKEKAIKLKSDYLTLKATLDENVLTNFSDVIAETDETFELFNMIIESSRADFNALADESDADGDLILISEALLKKVKQTQESQAVVPTPISPAPPAIVAPPPYEATNNEPQPPPASPPSSNNLPAYLAQNQNGMFASKRHLEEKKKKRCKGMCAIM